MREIEFGPRLGKRFQQRGNYSLKQLSVFISEQVQNISLYNRKFLKSDQ